MFHNTFQQLFTTRESKPIQNHRQFGVSQQCTTPTNNRYITHESKPTHHPNQSCCLHWSIKASWLSSRTQFRPSPFQSTQSAIQAWEPDLYQAPWSGLRTRVRLSHHLRCWLLWRSSRLSFSLLREWDWEVEIGVWRDLMGTKE